MQCSRLARPLLRRGAMLMSLLCAFTVARPSAAADGAASRADSDRPTSFSRDVQPILNRSCAACHKPGKLKGKLDLTGYVPFRTGGKTGPAFVPGEPDKSLVIEQVSGPEPTMPAKGEPLTAEEVATLSRWIHQGAKDDSRAVAVARAGTPGTPGTPGATSAGGAAPRGPPAPAHPTAYRVAPVITALAWSPAGNCLAVAGSHEVLIHQADGGGLVRRVPSGSPRTTSLFYSPDGRFLIAGGGAPGQFGQVQVWDASADYAPLKNWLVAADLPLGLTLSPAGDRLAFGCADRTARVIAFADGRELLKLEQHSDWVFGAAFSGDGGRLVTGGRDKSVKLLDASSGQFVDQLNIPQDPVTCLARHPTEPLVACGTAQGTTRLYRMTDLKKKTEQNRDPNLVKSLDRLPGAVNALAFTPDGTLLAVAGTGEARIYSPRDGGRVSTLSGSSGPVFALAFSPNAKQVCTAGFDGQVRIFATQKGQLLKSFVPVPVEPRLGGGTPARADPPTSGAK